MTKNTPRQPTTEAVNDLKRLLDTKPVQGITPMQAHLLSQLVTGFVETLTTIDGKDRHFALLVLTKETDDRVPVVASDMISSMDPDMINMFLADWLKATGK
jgi:hypothetical protein